MSFTAPQVISLYEQITYASDSSDERLVATLQFSPQMAYMHVDCTPHLAHKAEHAVEMETGAVVAVTLQEANRGDTTTVKETLQRRAKRSPNSSNGKRRKALWNYRR
jgi:hypothetical protein